MNLKEQIIYKEKEFLELQKLRIEKCKILTLLEIEANKQKMMNGDILKESKVDIQQFKKDIEYLRTILSTQSKELQVFYFLPWMMEIFSNKMLNILFSDMP